MCNLAGYVGDKAAAPILLEMTARQEGFAGGYYTGIATIAEGKLHYEKVVGDVATLIKETNAMTLPGTVGIVHSRSKSGGDVEWSHPFIDCTGRMAYVANGSEGYFATRRDSNAVLRRLANAGHTFRSRASGAVGNYPTLADGSGVHVSEVVCCLIESHVAEGLDPAQAMRRAYQEFPSAIVGLMVHEDMPESVIASRINQPLMIGRQEGATYMATTALAFPNPDMEWLMPMPINATAVIEREGIHILPMDPLPGPVSKILPWKEGYEKLLALLSDGEPKPLGACIKATAPLWPEDEVPQRDMMIYEILRDLHLQGLVDFSTVERPGVLSDTVMSQKQAYMVGK
jgi:glucosamine--fructose-6-phosphate aminotransferase (isomerizing)